MRTAGGPRLLLIDPPAPQGVHWADANRPPDYRHGVVANLCTARRAADGNGVFTADLPPGTYAASVLHDENRNCHIDFGFISLPKEGYGVTNTLKPKPRRATYSKAEFALPPQGTAVAISTQVDFM